VASNFVRNSMINALAGVCTTLGGFLSTVLVARILGLQGTGVVAFATWAVTVAVTLGDLGVTGALARFLPELRAKRGEEETAGLTRSLLKPFLCSTLGIALSFWLYAGWLLWTDDSALLAVQADAYRTSALFWGLVGIVCLAQSLGKFVNSWLKGMQDFSTLARLALLSSLVQICGTGIGAYWLGVPGALLASAIGLFVPALLLSRVVRSGPAPSSELRRRVTRFSLETWGSYLLTAFFASRMEVFFLERSWGSHAVGLFTVSLTLSNLATQGPLLLTGPLMPHLSHHIGTEQHDKAREIYRISIRLMALLVFPACLGTAAIAPVLLPMMYGHAFEPAILTATILVSAAAFVATASIAGVYLFAMEQTRFLLCAGVCGAVASILTGLTLVPAFGPVAAACSRAGIQLSMGASALWYMQRYLRCRTPFRELARLLIAAILSAMVARAIVMIEPNLIGVAIAIAAAAAVYALAVRVLHPLPPSDIERLGMAVMTLPRPLQPVARAGLQLIWS